MKKYLIKRILSIKVLHQKDCKIEIIFGSEGNVMEVYHGSPVCGMEKAIPKISSHGKPYVYAAKKRIIATLFLERWNDFIFNLGTTNDNGIEIIQLTERYENALYEVYGNKSGYLYTLDGTTFEEGKTSYSEEVVSEESVSVIRCEKIENILLEILNYEKQDKIKIFRFPERPSYIPVDNSDLIREAISIFRKTGDMKVIDYCIGKHPYLKEGLLKQLQ